MSSKTSMFHHPLHPMLIAFPLGLWFTSIIFDVWYSYSPPKYQIPPQIAYYCIIAGVIGAGLYIYLKATLYARTPTPNKIDIHTHTLYPGAAALPGMVDYLTLRDDKTVRGTATLHMLLNIVALTIFAADAYLRAKVPDHRTPAALILSGIGGVSIGCVICGSFWEVSELII